MIRLKALRTEKGLSQKEIAEYLGISQPAYANYERQAREADYDTLNKLADYFDCSIDYLLGRIDNNNNSQYINNKNTLEATLNIIGYIDILGVKEELLNGNENSELNIIHTIFKNAVTASNLDKGKYNIRIFSDNILIAKQTKSTKMYDDAFEVLKFLSYIQLNALLCGKLVRGSLCIGNLYIDNIFTLGKGLVTAHKYEDEIANYPRIIIENSVAKGILKSHYGIEPLIHKDFDNYYFIDSLYTIIDSVKLYEHAEDIVRAILNVMLTNTIKHSADARIMQKWRWAYYYLSTFCSKHSINIEYATPYIIFKDISLHELKEKMLHVDNNKKSTDYDKLDIEDKAEIRGMIKQMLKSPKYKKTDSYAQTIHDFDNAIDITPIFKQKNVDKD